MFFTLLLQHCTDLDSTTRPLLLVTASVDKIVLKKPITVDIDLKIVGSVIWVGRTSMEIQLEVIQLKKGNIASTFYFVLEFLVTSSDVFPMMYFK